MCGIAGAINFPAFDFEIAKRTLHHRGPDAQTTFLWNNVVLFHARLSIQDIAGGSQPFHYENFTLVFNGEIYNHYELRKTYLSDVKFTSHSDTETLLHLFVRYGMQMLEWLDGMFAFALLDKVHQKLYLARDRAGKKPLYYYHDATKLLFASEQGALRAQIPLEINNDAIEAFLRTGLFYGSTTPYDKVLKLSAGHILTIDLQTLKLDLLQYFDIQSMYKQSHKNADLLTAKEMGKKALEKSVKSRMLSSDLEVGAFLSGGIDSSLIVAMASKLTPNLKTFTVKFDGAYDESLLAKRTAEYFNTNHHELTIQMNLKDDIETILGAYGEPFFDSSAIPSYYVSKEAKKHVTVVLNGDGADELFAGYRRYVPIANHWLTTAKKFSFLFSSLPVPHEKKSLYNYLYRMLNMSQKRGIDFYCSATNDIFEDVYTFGSNPILAQMQNDIETVLNDSHLSELSKMLYLDFSILLFSDLLPKMDIATMSHSLEGRSPFLSKYMLELTPRLTDSLKIKGAQTKFILRELAKDLLPSHVHGQPKRGFEIPLKRWVENDLKEPIFDTLQNGCYSENFISRQFIDALKSNKIPVSAEKRAKMLWVMYSLEVWKKHA
jgi:asparagine synthase (glutamine-hydrolysing)